MMPVGWGGRVVVVGLSHDLTPATVANGRRMCLFHCLESNSILLSAPTDSNRRRRLITPHTHIVYNYIRIDTIGNCASPPFPTPVPGLTHCLPRRWHLVSSTSRTSRQKLTHSRKAPKPTRRYTTARPYTGHCSLIHGTLLAHTRGTARPYKLVALRPVLNIALHCFIAIG